LIYHSIPFRIRALSRFYSQFVEPDSLCFDIGAHLGNRTKALRRLDAKVVAVEPQPACISFLTRLFGGDPGVTIVPKAIGAKIGQGVMYLSRSTPTVSSLSLEWIQSLKGTPGFRNVQWDDMIQVEVTTLEALIHEHGIPAFTKIDVEGYEYEALGGLEHPLKLISFEYIPAVFHRAVACLERLSELGAYEFNWTIKERTRFVSSSWIGGTQLTEILSTMPPYHPSGDIYCRLIDSL